MACLSICFAGASWTKGCRTSSDTAIRSSLSTISACCSLLARRSPPTFGPISPRLLALAQYENVRVKISGACTMSHQPFPYDDVWEPVLRVIDAFGLDRCMWGTDWTRTIGMLTYEQGVAPFRDTKRLSENDKAALMGGTLQKVYKW